MGLKLHEDWGTTPAAIDNCLSVADTYDIQVRYCTSSLFFEICFFSYISSISSMLTLLWTGKHPH